MGIFNDTASVDAFAINAYCIVSALFFSACAYAQLNDPNPVQWFCAYVFGGTVPNLYWMTTAGNSNSNVNFNSSFNSSTVKQKLVLSLHGFVALMALAILYKLVTVAPKLLEDVTEHHHGILWAFMEHEEGRDSCGLLLLILHASYLNSVIARGPRNPRRSPRNSNRSDRGEDGASGTMALPPTLVAVVLFGVLGYCVYVWIVHHPDLVAKHGLKHCQGEMFGRMDGGEL
jgi:hypothetical protein